MDMIDHPQPENLPLLSNRFLLLTTAIICLLAVASVAISIVGKLYGDRLSLAGHSESTRQIDITVGRDVVRLTENTMRFDEQRHSGPQDRLDLYLAWPELTGFSRQIRERFETATNSSLIFLQISQSTMSKDMSGRMEPIYRQLLTSSEIVGPAGLAGHEFKPRTGYDGEILYTATDPDLGTYVIRCLAEVQPAVSSGGDCQRDIHVGRDLSVLYRFPRSLLGDWRAIENSVRHYMESRILPAEAESGQ